MSKKEKILELINNELTFDIVFEETFNAMDTNKNGFIEKSELYDMLADISKRAFKYDPPKKEGVEKIMSQYDENKDGKLSKEEIKPYLKKLMIQMAELGLL